jgi:long-chain acyl-CoA synthetase
VVADAAVVGLADPEWGQCVTATIEPRPDRRDVESIEQHCRAQLAGYKVPRRFDFVDAMPRNEVGKVSRRNLRDARAADATNA